MSESDDKYWYNLETKQVEHGSNSPRKDLVGPFDTAEEAAAALEVIAKRNEEWDADDAANS